LKSAGISKALKGKYQMNVMRPARLTAKLTASALGLALGAAMLTLPVPVRAADDDVPLDSKILRGILEGIGLERNGASINYQERAPLVIPSSKDLPPPQKADSAIANNPAWPKDPDVARRKAEEKRERTRNITEEIERDSKPLSPDQLAPGARGQRTATRQDGAVSESIGPLDARNRLTPKQLGTKSGLFDNIFGHKGDGESAKFTSEPARTSLTDPPPGYQVPSPDQPYGLGKAAPPKPENYLVKHGEIDRNQ
jgi:hypothetical protein